MGRRQDRALQEHPEISRAYQVYLLCRKRQLVVATIPRGQKGETTTKMLPYTDGFNCLPVGGGVLDQPHRLMQFFSAFEDGEQEAFSIKLK